MFVTICYLWVSHYNYLAHNRMCTNGERMCKNSNRMCKNGDKFLRKITLIAWIDKYEQKKRLIWHHF